MQRLILSALAWLALVCSAGAQTVRVPVTPDHLEYSNFVFAVNVTNAGGGAAFHIVITTKTQPIGSDCAAAVTDVTAMDGSAKSLAVASLTPPVNATLNRTARVWTADFVAPAVVLNNPGACFIFVVPDYTTDATGQRTYQSTDRMYEIRLQDFLRH